MSEQNIMAWLERLPDVSRTALPAERDVIAAKLDEVRALEAKAQALKGEAYMLALRLEASARQQWGDDAVEHAKRQA